MLGALSDFLIALLELLEAEARSARKGIVELSISLLLVGLAGALLLGAIGFLIWALFLLIDPHLPRAASAVICAVVVLLFAGALLFSAKRKAQ